MPFLTSLETKKGEAVDESTLAGKLVVLYYSANWCPACKAFTPLLSVLYDEAKEEGKDFEVVYVSSDDSESDCQKYMDAKHSDWLRIPYGSQLRQELKAKFGAFAGKEQADFADAQRRSGIPTMLVVSGAGQELAMLDCDSAQVRKEMENEGVSYLDRWANHKY